jgi:hypothetical protein
MYIEGIEKLYLAGLVFSSLFFVGTVGASSFPLRTYKKPPTPGNSQMKLCPCTQKS